MTKPSSIFPIFPVNVPMPTKTAIPPPAPRRLPPPMRIRVEGWFTNREMTMPEAEAYHLREAAKHAGHPTIQDYHLFQAECNRFWASFSETVKC